MKAATMVAVSRAGGEGSRPVRPTAMKAGMMVAVSRAGARRTRADGGCGVVGVPGMAEAERFQGEPANRDDANRDDGDREVPATRMLVAGTVAGPPVLRDGECAEAGVRLTSGCAAAGPLPAGPGRARHA
jgi:hypothetical protein